MGELRFIYGGKQAGYRLRRLKRKDFPWETQVWFDGRIWRRDLWATKEEALEFIEARMKIHYGKGGLKKRTK